MATYLAMTPTVVAGVDPGPGTAPQMDFTPLPPGSYRLPHIQDIPDAVLLSSSGRPVHLKAATRDKVTLLTFFYSYCVEPLGCQFAHQTLTMLRDRILEDAQLTSAVRFVGISCDPSNDRPETLAAYARQFKSDERFEWQFLTAPSVPDLLPVLDDLGQDVSVEVDAQGRATRALHHMLKVFLIDPHGSVREIYTLAYLQPEVMLNDIRTLVGESGRH